MEVLSLLEGEWSSYKRWSVECRENDHVTEAASLMEGEWSCYRGGQFNRGRMVMLQNQPV